MFCYDNIQFFINKIKEQKNELQKKKCRMFDFCKIKNAKCAFSYKNVFCGEAIGNNIIEEMEQCPKKIKTKNKGHTVKENKKQIKSNQRLKQF